MAGPTDKWWNVYGELSPECNIPGRVLECMNNCWIGLRVLSKPYLIILCEYRLVWLVVYYSIALLQVIALLEIEYLFKGGAELLNFKFIESMNESESILNGWNFYTRGLETDNNEFVAKFFVFVFNRIWRCDHLFTYKAPLISIDFVGTLSIYCIIFIFRITDSILWIE